MKRSQKAERPKGLKPKALALWNSYVEAYGNDIRPAVPEGKVDELKDTAKLDARRQALSKPARHALEFWVKLSRAHNAIAAHAAADVAQHGMTLAEFGILEALYHRGPMLLGEVQRRILVSSGGITFLIDRLTAKGLVERRQCTRDKRARYATLTAQGEALVAQIFPAHAAAIERAVASLDVAKLELASAVLREVGLAAAQLCPVTEAGEANAADGALDSTSK